MAEKEKSQKLSLQLVFTMFILCNEAMISKFNHLKIGYEVRSIHEFKFDKGGTLKLSGAIVGDDENESLYLYHCTDNEIKNLNKYTSMHKLCANINDFECSYDLWIKNDIDYSFHSLKKQWMTMIIISCSENKEYGIASLNIKSTSTSYEYLSLNEINYKHIFLYLLIIYISLFLIYFIHLFRFRYFNIALQILLIFYPLFGSIQCLLKHFVWSFASHYGTFSEFYLILSYIFDGICDGLLVLILLFICFGWKFINNRIQHKSVAIKLEIALICLFIVISSILRHYYSSMLLFYVICYVLCGRRMYVSMTTNLNALQTQIEILETIDNVDIVIKSPANIKRNILKLFEKVIIIFVAAKISLYWISSSLLFEYHWIDDIMAHLLLITLITFLFWNFRMSRSFKPYFYLIDDNIYEWNPTTNRKIHINYNLCFECDMLIIENSIDYFKNENILKNFSLSAPFTIDLKNNDNDKFDNDINENTPLLYDA